MVDSSDNSTKHVFTTAHYAASMCSLADNASHVEESLRRCLRAVEKAARDGRYMLDQAEIRELLVPPEQIPRLVLKLRALGYEAYPSTYTEKGVNTQKIHINWWEG